MRSLGKILKSTSLLYFSPSYFLKGLETDVYSWEPVNLCLGQIKLCETFPVFLETYRLFYKAFVGVSNILSIVVLGGSDDIFMY